MTREQALAKLQECTTYDTEGAHVAADEVLCKLLQTLGYEDVVVAWEKVDKWYS